MIKIGSQVRHHISDPGKSKPPGEVIEIRKAHA
jgi:hypothetical protein